MQRVGRVIRQAPDKQPSEIYDFIAVPYEGDAGTGLLEKKHAERRIAANAINYDEVKALFLENGVDLDANQ